MAAIFLAFVLMVGAGSVGAALVRFLAFDRAQAALVAVGLLAVFGLLQVLIARARDRSEIGDRIADLSRGAADLARQVAEVGRRLAAAEAELARSAERTCAALEPTAAEIELLRRSAQQLAQSVGAHEQVLKGLSGLAGEPGRPAAVSLALDAMRGPAPGTDGQPGNGSEGHHLGNGGANDGMTAIRRAAEAGRFELYLQPIVTLPQRRVRYYEALARLRAEDGALLNPCDHLRDPHSAEVLATIDDILLYRCVQVARRLIAKERDIGVFCHITGHSLLDPAFLAQVSDFIEANRALSTGLVFEFSQKRVRQMGATERECLAELAALGFRFAMNRAGDLVLDPRELAERGFRFVKIPARLLLNRAEAKAAGIEASEFSDRLGRFGIDLIAEEIESETNVVDLLDYDVRFGQGPLFSPPRPVRADVVEGADQPLPRASGGTILAPAGPAGPAEPPSAIESFAAAETAVPAGLSLGV